MDPYEHGCEKDKSSHFTRPFLQNSSYQACHPIPEEIMQMLRYGCFGETLCETNRFPCKSVRFVATASIMVIVEINFEACDDEEEQQQEVEDEDYEVEDEDDKVEGEDE